jgi:hypothetical protein
MTQRVRRELHAVAAAKPTKRAVLLTDGAAYIDSHAHYGSQGLAAFVQRMVKRGLTLKETK